MGVTLISPTAAHGGLNWDTNLETNLGRLATAINGATALGASTDLNSGITQSGAYLGTGLTNTPGGSTGTFLVEANYSSASSQTQLAYALPASGGIWARGQAAGTWSAWTRLDVPDTGWSLTPIALASGWNTRTDPNGNTSSLAGGVRRVGELVEYRFRANRSGADINGTTSGNIGPDVTLATINPTTYPQFVPAAVLEGRFGVIGVQAGTVRIDATGLMVVTDIYPNDSIANGSTIQVQILGLAD